ncbi:MAG: PCMD domain-containing protein [Bacteroidota bacterium]
MKKFPYISFVVVAVCCGFFAALNSCRPYIDDVPLAPPPTLECQLNIRGGCLDQWEQIDDGFGNRCLEPAGDFLRTLNYLTTLPAQAGGPGPLTTDSTSDAYSGKYAALLITCSFSPQGQPILIPGLLGTDSLDISNQNIKLGKRYSNRPSAFLGYYKYQPVGGDSALVSVLLSKYNTTSHRRDTVGWVKQIYKGATSTYTAINLPIAYFSADTPDSLTLLVCSSAGVNFADVFHCTGQVGSKMWIDEIQFVLP